MVGDDQILRTKLFYAVLSFSWFMCLLQIFGIFLFKKHYELLIIQKRYPRFVLVEAINCVLLLLVIFPNNLNHSLKVLNNPVEKFGLHKFFISFTSFIVPTIEICRIWLIAFDLHYLRSSKNQHWKSQIDVTYADKDWYLRNRGKWGNKRFIIRIGIMYYLITSSLSFIPWVVTGSDTMFMVAYNGFCALIVSTEFCVYLKTPKRLDDEFLFELEFKLTTLIWITALFTLTCVVTTETAFPEYYTITTATIDIIGIVALNSPSLISTVLIPIKVSRMMAWKRTASVSPTVSSEYTGDFRLKLQETLNDEHKCEAFIDWMYREFSSEAILSTLECVQFKQYIKQEIGKIDGSDVSTETDRFDFELFDGMPRSTIVYDTWSLVHIEKGNMLSGSDALSLSEAVQSGSSPTDDPLIKAKRIAHILFMKYIDYHAELEINISGSLRNKYVHLDQTNYEGMELEHFLTLHNDLISEMMKYQSQSYRRFSRSSFSNST